MAVEHDTLVRLAIQHARTAQLLGADFIPRFRTPDSGLGESPVMAIESAAQQTPRAETRREPPREHTGSSESLPPRSAEPARPARVAPAGSSSGAAPSVATAPRGPRDGAAIQVKLDALRARYEKDAPHERFKTPFTKIVFGEGDPAARLLFVGEAPGEDEDLSGRPFVGRAGQLLEKMIIGMGLTRQQVYICNVLKTRPPGNRPPTPEEVVASAPYLYEQIATIGPEVIVTLGRPATHLLLRTQDAMGRLRGQWGQFEMPDAPAGFNWPPEWGALQFAVMPTYHPSYLLRSYTDENRKAVWSDLKQVLDRLGLKPPTRAGGAVA